jgi:hypothetical protein
VSTILVPLSVAFLPDYADVGAYALEVGKAITLQLTNGVGATAEAEVTRLAATMGYTAARDIVNDRLRRGELPDRSALLDHLGLTVRAPIIPRPVPPPELLARLSAMYGDSPAAQGAAYRTGEAMERRRQGWTRQGARDEWQRRMLENLPPGTTGLA